jgi:CubicO group peptidase (beta-lactamase class C family)
VPIGKIPVALAAFAVLSVAVMSISACRQSESQAARVDQLFAAWDRKDAPGCAVGISRNGDILYKHGYGMANLERNVPITPDTVFGIASITKAFTAMSILLAAEQGKLSLDDDVQKYIPEWQDRDDHVTIRHLLTHTSGIRDGFGLLGWADPNESAGDVNEALARMLARQRGVNFLPGSENQYNNGGYNLLATILKRATGQSLGEFADANIFKPLGMTHTLVRGNVPMTEPNRAWGYTKTASGWSAARDWGGAIGNDGMYSTVGDLLRWEENFDNPRVGTREMFAAMEKPTVLTGGKAISAGIGFGLSQYRGVPAIESSGGSWGIASKVARFPKQHFAVAVLCNEDNIVMGGMARVNPDVFTNGLADIYLPDALKPAESANKTGPPPAAAPTPVKLSDAELSEKTGLYRAVGVDLPILVAVDHGTVMARSYYGDDFDFELTPVSANRFLLRNTIPFEFVPAAPDHPKEWRAGEGKDQRIWEQVTFALPASGVRAYAGNYRSDELGVTYTLEARDSALVVKARGRPGVTIAPFSKDVFVGDWVGIVKFTRDRSGAVTGFTVNRDNARGVRFDRIK